MDPLVAIVVLTPLMFALGWLLYNGTIRPIRRAPPAASVLLTFGLALLLEGLMGVIWGNTSHSVRPGYFTESFQIGELFLPKAQVYGGLVAIVVLASLYLVLTRSWTGRAIRASAANPQGAELVGVNVAAVAAMTFAVGVAVTGAGGSIVSVLYPFLPGSHYVWISRLLGIIVLGGMGSLPIAGAAFLLAFPLASDDLFWQNMIILSTLFAIGAVGLNIISGWGGYISLGQSAFVGAGPYTVALGSLKVGG